MPEKREPDSPAGVAAARAYAQRWLGDAAWADDLLDAYFNPEPTMDKLNAERDELA